MKKTPTLNLWKLLALCLALLIAAMPALGEEDDSEESLLWLLSDQTGIESFEHFYYGDYDGDGIREAFALVTADGSLTGDLWFISPLFIEPVQTGLSYASFEMCGAEAPILFTAEENYGGSGSTVHLWSVVDSAPVKINADVLGSFEHGDGNEFYAYISAFDMFTDGTGHTWKRYYYYLDGLTMREYGGMYITEAQLLEFDGAEEILQSIKNSGGKIGDIIYRANGIININVRSDDRNDNVTLRYDESSVVDTGESYGGIYSLAGDSSIAVYPTEFVHPVSQVSEQNAEQAAAIESVTSVTGEVLSLEPIHSALGIYSMDELSYTRGAECTVDGNLQKYRIHLQEDVFYGGSEGYVEDWRTSEGIMCDAELDMDLDGVNEYLVLYIRDEPDEYDYITHNMYISIYEPSEGGYVLADTFLIDVYRGFGSDYIRLIESEQGIYLSKDSSFSVDGGGWVTRNVLYGYDGQQFTLEALADTTTEPYASYMVVGPLDPDMTDEIRSAADDYDYDPSAAQALGLVPDENLFIFDVPDSVDYLQPDTTRQVADMLAPYGLILICSDRGGYYDVEVNSGEYFWYSDETMEDSGEYAILWLYSSLDHSGGTASADAPAAQTDSAAQAYIRATSDVNMRSGPGTDYGKLGILPSGSLAAYEGITDQDSRGVMWYNIHYNGVDAWVSSKYAVPEN